MTIRLDDDLAEDLATVASVRGSAVTDVVRAAITAHVRTEKADPGFRAALRERIARERRMLGDDEAA